MKLKENVSKKRKGLIKRKYTNKTGAGGLLDDGEVSLTRPQQSSWGMEKGGCAEEMNAH